MDDYKLKTYIEDYITKNQSGKALALIGEWGIGKSYFIEKELIPYLSKKEKNIKVIRVSAYGLNSITELSQKILFESILKNSTHKFNTRKKISIYSKNILVSLLGLVNFHLDFNESDISSILKSRNLDNALIIIEDQERSRIPYETLMGFVNDICENNNGKVLVVLNRKKLVASVKDNVINENEDKIFYKKINYSPNFKTAIDNIFNSYDSFFKEIVAKNEWIEWTKLYFSKKGKEINLRSLISYIQNFIDFLNNEISGYTQDFLFELFKGGLNIFENNKQINFDGSFVVSTEYDLEKYFYFKSFYNYLKNTVINEQQLKEENEQYIEYLNKTYDEKEFENIVDNIHSCFHFSEKDLIGSIEKLNEFLMKKNLDEGIKIKLIDLGTSLIVIKHELKIDKEIDDTLTKIKEYFRKYPVINFRNRFFRSVIGTDIKEAHEEAKTFEKEIYEICSPKNQISDNISILKSLSIRKDECVKEGYHTPYFLYGVNFDSLIDEIIKDTFSFRYIFAEANKYGLLKDEDYKFFSKLMKKLSMESNKSNDRIVKWRIASFNEFLEKLK